MSEAAEVIIIRKKRAGHAAHHGGAWKVAYADFVTAMMSLFIVLWLISSNDNVKQSVAAYFQDPKGTAKLAGSSSMGAGHEIPLRLQDMDSLKKRLQQAAKQLPQFEKLSKQIEISALPDGLHIELLEDPGGTFFQLGSATPTTALAQFLAVASRELGKVPNRISVEGHTDALPYSKGGDYTNWELSSDRANAARRLMQSNGLHPGQIAQVRGFADQQLRDPAHPTDSANRRVTLIVEAEAGGAAKDTQGSIKESAEEIAPAAPTQKKQELSQRAAAE